MHRHAIAEAIDVYRIDRSKKVEGQRRIVSGFEDNSPRQKTAPLVKSCSKEEEAMTLDLRPEIAIDDALRISCDKRSQHVLGDGD